MPEWVNNTESVDANEIENAVAEVKAEAATEPKSDDQATLESVTNEQDNAADDSSDSRAESEPATVDVVDQQHTNTDENSVDQSIGNLPVSVAR